MSLMVTSCTMASQPGRLLSKGPEYLRTRTNGNLFCQDRPSATELLAASRRRFYHVTDSQLWGTQQDLVITAGQRERLLIQKNEVLPKREVTRSKSVHNLQDLSSGWADQDIGRDFLHQSHTPPTVTHLPDGERSSLQPDECVHLRTGHVLRSAPVHHYQNGALTAATSSLALKIVQPADKIRHDRNGDPEPLSIKDGSRTKQLDFSISSRDSTYVETSSFRSTRKFVEEPFCSLQQKIQKHNDFCQSKDASPLLKEVIRSPSNLPVTSVSRTAADSDIFNSKKQLLSAEQKSEEKRLGSILESLNQKFTSLGATSNLQKQEQPSFPSRQESSQLSRSKVSGTFRANPVVLLKSSNYQSNTQHSPLLPLPLGDSTKNPTIPKRVLETYCGNNTNRAGKKRCPENLFTLSNLEKRDTSNNFGDTLSRDSSAKHFQLKNINHLRQHLSLKSTTSNMSIESVDPAVYESDINALPGVTVERTNTPDLANEAREVARSNSALSGKMSSSNLTPCQPAAVATASTVNHQSSIAVPRSQSDISCTLDSHHCPNKTLASSRSCQSRASVGAELENFFNQMGLEKGVLDPLNKLRELQAREVFNSVSSLDSQDAASICSTFSRSEPDWTDSNSTDHNHLQQTSIVERNARIIKWLCNVRKAKNQIHVSDKPSLSKA